VGAKASLWSREITFRVSDGAIGAIFAHDVNWVGHRIVAELKR
jgi:hypothetical protein